MNLRNLAWSLTFVATNFLFIGCGNNGSSSASDASSLSAVGLTATGASLQCASSGKNAFSTYGAAAFLAVNSAIIANVGSELTAHGTTNLGGSFATSGTGAIFANQDNLTTFSGHLAAFLVFLYGGPSYLNFSVGNSSAAGNPPIPITFNGPQSMLITHTGFNITQSQYTYFVTNIVVPALASSGVPSGDISSCFAPPLLDTNFAQSIVGH